MAQDIPPQEEGGTPEVLSWARKQARKRRSSDLGGRPGMPAPPPGTQAPDMGTPEELSWARKQARKAILWIYLPFAIALLFGFSFRYIAINETIRDLHKISEAVQQSKAQDPEQVAEGLVRFLRPRGEERGRRVAAVQEDCPDRGPGYAPRPTRARRGRAAGWGRPGRSPALPGISSTSSNFLSSESDPLEACPHPPCSGNRPGSG